ncbi:MAG: hypothetical protein MI717_10175 [Spirochaetales bacterium]|nr:hypothetical protein [Spirochaetales bacterium]
MPDIHLAFRFRVNLHHSDRGEGLDQDGIGRDIDHIRTILQDLDTLNTEGIPVQATWSIESHNTLGQLIPKHAPDLLESWQRRVTQNRDEVEAVHWNHGLISAMNQQEFLKSLEWGQSNAEDSGIANLFHRWAPVLRPPEGFLTSAHIPLYVEAGISGLSFPQSDDLMDSLESEGPEVETGLIPHYLKDLHTGKKLLYLPSFGPQDIARHMGLKHWIRSLLKKQGEMAQVLVIDADVTDRFWKGYGTLGALNPSAGGLAPLIRSIADLEGVHFSTPWTAMQKIPAAKTLCLRTDHGEGRNQDYCSWCEKRENTRLWTGIAKSRLLDSWRTTLLGDSLPPGSEALEEAALKARLVALDSRYYGPSSPHLHQKQLTEGEKLTHLAYEQSSRALAVAQDNAPEAPCPIRSADELLPPVLSEKGEWSLPTIESPNRRRVPGEAPAFVRVMDQQRTLISGRTLFTLETDGRMSLENQGHHYINPRSSRPSLRYGGKEVNFTLKDFLPPMVVSEGLTRMSQSMEAKLPGGPTVQWDGAFYMGDDQPWVLCDVHVRYPRTECKERNPQKSRRLMRTWDKRWQELRPLELGIIPQETGEKGYSLWNKDAFGYLNHHSPLNTHRGCWNTHLSLPWLALSKNNRGLLLGTTPQWESNFACAPLRYTGKRSDDLKINPFGVYHSKKLSNSFNGNADQHQESGAPSYNGEEQRIVVLLIPYEGEQPPEQYTKILDEFAAPSWTGSIPWGNQTIPPSKNNGTEEPEPLPPGTIPLYAKTG